MRIVALLLLTALAGCAGHDLATPSGQMFVFNPGQWSPSAADMVAPARSAQ